MSWHKDIHPTLFHQPTNALLHAHYVWRIVLDSSRCWLGTMYTQAKTEETTNSPTHLGGELCVLRVGLSWQLLSYGCLSPSEQCNLMTKQSFCYSDFSEWLTVFVGWTAGDCRAKVVVLTTDWPDGPPWQGAWTGRPQWTLFPPSSECSWSSRPPRPASSPPLAAMTSSSAKSNFMLIDFQWN